MEALGTGGGFKLFCEGVGVNSPDISNASRLMTQSERELCHKHGVTDILEVPIGYDGIVIAGTKDARAVSLSKKQLFMALARDLPDKNGALQRNRFVRWKEIDPALPDAEIAFYGPPPTSGTRDAFVELVMEKGCEQFPAFAKAYPDEKERKKKCHLIREDGHYIEAGEDDNIIVQKLGVNPHAFGILGYSFYAENTNRVQAAAIDGVLPDFASIEEGKYKVSRSLFIYVKKQHVGQVPGLSEFVQEVVSDYASGPEGYMTARGLLPLHGDERAVLKDKVRGLK